LDSFDADAAARLELPADDVRRFAARREEVSGEPLEVAVDLVPPHDRFDLVDRRRMALPRQAGVLRAVQLLDPEEPVVDRAREMGRRPAGLAAPDDAVLEDRDALAFLRQEVRRAEPEDAAADDRDVDLDLPLQLRKDRPGGAGQPGRAGSAGRE